MNKPLAAVKAPEVEVDRHATAAVALGEILGTRLDHLRTNQSAASYGDAEGVHQMRVAIRRLRAGLVLFDPLLEPSSTQRFEQELRRIGQIFGGARDWDVFCLEMLPACAAETGQQTPIDRFREMAEHRRHVAHESFVRELAGSRYTQVINDLSSWAAGEPAVARHRSRPLRDLAPDLLARLARKVDRRGRHLQRRSTEELHGLRKSLKKLRYGADDLSHLFGPKRVKSFRRGCKALQENLGEVNDAASASRLAEALRPTLRPEAADTVEIMVSWSHHRRDAAVRNLPKAWDEFRDAPRFWE